MAKAASVTYLFYFTAIFCDLGLKVSDKSFVIRDFLAEVFYYISCMYCSDGYENRTFLKKRVVLGIKEIALHSAQA